MSEDQVIVMSEDSMEGVNWFNPISYLSNTLDSKSIFAKVRLICNEWTRYPSESPYTFNVRIWLFPLTLWAIR